MLKEQFNDADTTPVSTEKFNELCQKLSKEFGIQIQHDLNKDDWLFDTLTNKEYVEHFRKIYEEQGRDIFDAFVYDVKQKGDITAETDADLWDRTLLFKEKLLKMMEQSEKKILVVSHGLFLKVLLSDRVEAGSVMGRGCVNSMFMRNAQACPFYYDGEKFMSTHNYK